MKLRLALILLAASTGVLGLFIAMRLLLRRCSLPEMGNNRVTSGDKRADSLQTGIARIHEKNLAGDGSGKVNSRASPNGVSRRTAFFNWADNPSLIIDAVENGWWSFAFRSVKSARSSLSGICPTCDQKHGADLEIGWEIPEGSSDFMQKVKLNPGLKKVYARVNSCTEAVSVITTSLPLPGPQVGNLAFPQEAFFEITILCSDRGPFAGGGKENEGEKIKLIEEDFHSKMSPDLSGNVTGDYHRRRKSVDYLKLGRKNEVIFLSVGMTGGDTLPLKVPGSYPGSIGFNSNGSVYLDGMKMVSDSEEDAWARTPEKVIGCGYNPAKKKVFFTVDSQLVHEIYCKTEEFGHPLYPTLAANTEITVLVNFGQSPFRFTQANNKRTENPCFMGPLLENYHSAGYEDSGDLFSIGKIEPQWLRQSAVRSNNSTVNSVRVLQHDHESDGELYEIVLDSTGKSPPFATHQ